MAVRKPKDPEESAVRKLAKPPSKTPAQLMAEAEAVESKDTETILRELELIQHERSRWTSEKGDLHLEYVAARDRAVAALGDQGPRYFIDANDVKTVGVVSRPEKLYIDARILEGLDEETLNRVAPRKIDNDKLVREVLKKDGKIKRSAFLRYAKTKPITPFVRFIRPGEADPD